MSDWLPIDTAPKANNGVPVPILGFCPDERDGAGGGFDARIRVIWWGHNIRGGAWRDDTGHYPTPRYWQPLPEPPEEYRA